MAQRGRKSAESLGLTVIDVQAQRLRAPNYLKAQEKVIFEHIVSNCAPTHFKASEIPMLALYCTAIHLARFYADGIGDDPAAGKGWTENARLAASLATKLRLTPQTRFDARAAERYSLTVSAESPRPWESA
jgi:hypothetical protein